MNVAKCLLLLSCMCWACGTQDSSRENATSTQTPESLQKKGVTEVFSYSKRGNNLVSRLYKEAVSNSPALTQFEKERDAYWEEVKPEEVFNAYDGKSENYYRTGIS